MAKLKRGAFFKELSMERNFNQPILQLDGKPFDDQLTLGKAVFMCTSTQLRGDESLDLNAKLRLYALSKLGFDGGVSVKLTSEDVTTIKERAARAFSNYIVVGRIVDALENISTP
jgi:hypothetical protein